MTVVLPLPRRAERPVRLPDGAGPLAHPLGAATLPFVFPILVANRLSVQRPLNITVTLIGDLLNITVITITITN